MCKIMHKSSEEQGSTVAIWKVVLYHILLGIIVVHHCTERLGEGRIPLRRRTFNDPARKLCKSWLCTPDPICWVSYDDTWWGELSLPLTFDVIRLSWCPVGRRTIKSYGALHFKKKKSLYLQPVSVKGWRKRCFLPPPHSPPPVIENVCPPSNGAACCEVMQNCPRDVAAERQLEKMGCELWTHRVRNMTILKIFSTF